METDDKRLTVRDWAENDRPREKMLLRGAQSLSDAELLAILIGSGSKTETVVELSRRILHDCNDNLNELARLTVSDLCKRFKGIGQAKAITIMASMELGKRRKLSASMERKKISSSTHLFELFEPILVDLPHEEFWVAMLTGANKVIEMKRLTQGGTNQTVVDLPMLLKMAIERSAVTIAVGHNHPSGQNRPSNEDINITNRIKEGCKAVGINLLDHIIIAHDKYYSFSDEGKI
ncbi:MAG: RadC family protein [Paludibacter sp.]